MFRCSHRYLQLSGASLASALQSLPGWQHNIAEKRETIDKLYVFADFKDAWSFMESVVPFLNDTDHHPEWSNVYNRVQVSLTTHDVGNKVSDKDIALARKMEENASRFLSK